MHFRIDRLARDGVWLAVVAAISVAVVSAAMGPARQSQFGGHDVPFAIATLSALWQGWDFAPGLPPGWLMPMVCGFGAPVLYFYPPGGFLFGAAWLAVGDLSPAAALSVASLVARLTGMLFCFLWLRRLCSGHAALLGAAAYGLFPYNALFNPVVRFAYAEVMATALLPLLPLVLGAALPPLRRIGVLALVVAAIGFVHVPTVLMALAMGGIYALALGWRVTVQAVAGFALAVLVLSVHLLPAILLTPEISAGELMDEGHSWRGTMLFWGSMATQQVSLVWLMLYALFGLALAGLLLWLWAGWGRRGREGGAVLLAGFAALAFIGPVSLPAWMLLPPMDYIQFPWRFLMPAGLFFAAALALSWDRLAPGARSALTLGTAGMALVMPCFILMLQLGKPEARLEFPGPGATATAFGPECELTPEYVPAAAQQAGWGPFVRAEQTLPGVSTQVQVISGDVRLDGAELQRPVIRLVGEAVSAAELRVPQFWFPGWAMRSGQGVLDADPATGLLRVTVPSGRFDVQLHRVVLPITRLAAIIGGLALLLVLALLLWPARRQSRMPVPGR